MALHLAIRDNDIAAVEKLINQKVNLNAVDSRGCGLTPLYLSMKQGRIEIMELLLEAGADVNSKTEQIPLHFSVQIKSVEMTELLLKYDAVVDRKNHTGETALMLALGRKFFDLARVLIKHGAKVDACTNRGVTSLHLAAKRNDVETVNFLLSLGANVNGVDNEKRTPLHFACLPGDKKKIYNLEIIELLLENGANPDAVNSDDLTPLTSILHKDSGSYRTAENLTEALEFLLRYSDVSAACRQNKNILTLTKTREQLWKMIVEHMAIVGFVNSSARTDVLSAIASCKKFMDHFKRCRAELARAKDTNIGDSSVTFFHLLTDDVTQMKKHREDKHFGEDFQTTDCLKRFPIYGASIVKGVEKELRRRDSAEILGSLLPIFESNGRITGDILDCGVLREKDLAKLCESVSKI